MQVKGPIFISHSSIDRESASKLGVALRQAFGERLRTFNTSSGTAIQAGDRWRTVILQALRDAEVVILWGSRSACESKEVAFEIGAAFAYERKVIPCAVHIPPRELPWSLSELQAPALDTEEGWIQLAQSVADAIDYPSAVNEAPLRELARQFTAPGDALEVTSLGMTVELRNTSSAAITSIMAKGMRDTLPQWAIAVQGLALQPGEATILLRGLDRSEHSIEFVWRDVAGSTHRRVIGIAEVIT